MGIQWTGPEKFLLKTPISGIDDGHNHQGKSSRKGWPHLPEAYKRRKQQAWKRHSERVVSPADVRLKVRCPVQDCKGLHFAVGKLQLAEGMSREGWVLE